MSLRLEINTTPTQWAVTPQPGRLNLSTTLPRIEMNTTAAQLEITGNHPGELSIDFTESRAAVGLKTWTQLSLDWAEAGRQGALEAIGNLASDGDRLMNFQNGDAIVEMARESTLQETPSIEWAYKPGPEISYTLNRPQVEATPGKVDVQPVDGAVTNNTAYPQFAFQITQYGRVDINVVGSRTDQNV